MYYKKSDIPTLFENILVVYIKLMYRLELIGRTRRVKINNFFSSDIMMSSGGQQGFSFMRSGRPTVSFKTFIGTPACRLPLLVSS